MTGQDYDPRDVEHFERFNRQRFFEAHEVLEALWLPQPQGPNGAPVGLWWLPFGRDLSWDDELR